MFARLSFIAIALCNPCAMANITLTPGSILASSSSTNQIYQYDSVTGAQVGSLTLYTTPPGSSEVRTYGITVLNGEIYVSYATTTTTGIARVDRNTGQVLTLPPTPPIFGSNGLTTRNGNLVIHSAGYVGQINPVTGVELSHIGLQQFPYGEGSQVEEGFSIAFDGTNYLSMTKATNNHIMLRWYDGNTGLAARSPEDLFSLGDDPAGLDFDTKTNILRYSTIGSGPQSYIRTFSGASTPQIVVSGVRISDIVTVPIPTPGAMGLAIAPLFLASRRKRRTSKNMLP